jgi:hypothetical protein
MPRTSNRTLPSRVTAALRYSGVVSTSDVVGAALPAVAALVAAADVAASQAHNNRTTSIVRPVPSPSPRHLGRCHARMMRGGRVLIGSLLTPVASYVIVPGLAPCAVLASVLGVCRSHKHDTGQLGLDRLAVRSLICSQVLNLIPARTVRHPHCGMEPPNQGYPGRGRAG